MVKRDTREIDNLFCTSGTSPDPPALADLGADQDLAKDCTLGSRKKATRRPAAVGSRSPPGPHRKHTLSMGVCWAGDSGAPSFSGRRALILSLHLSQVLSPAFGIIMNPMCVKLETKVISQR